MVGGIPESWSQMLSVEKLHLQNNGFEGAIPEFFGTFSHLQELILSNNRFNGSIPSSLGNLSNLVVLDLHQNDISGEMPSSLANVASLNYLDIGNTFINGSIPPWLGSLTNLTSLYIYNTPIAGTLPEELANLTSLVTIFELGVQRSVCVKNPPTSPTISKSSSKSTTQQRTSLPSLSIAPTNVRVENDGESLTAIITTFIVISATSTPSSPAPTTTNDQRNGETSRYAIASMAGSVAAGTVVALVFALFYWRHAMRNIHSKTETLNIEESNDGSQQVLERQENVLQPRDTVTLSPLATINPSAETESTAVISPPFLEVEPASLAEIQAIAGRVPQRNVIQLEINLQREHGLYQSWPHDLVLEWAQTRRFEHPVRNFFISYHIDGEAITNLNMAILSSKYEVVDFRTRAMIMQAVEYLRHSAKSNVFLEDPTVLPLYQE
ncbi:hypothetical protein HDU76_008469 [Blyttiomyces sp. JEL0837]|nr:hypothetical protein HDU76_008469 [Blyttiomyces sp. JEL0837]